MQKKVEGVVSLRDKKVVLSVCPQREFYFLSKNRVGCKEGKIQHVYQRQRRGMHVTWLESQANFIEPRVVTRDGGGLDEQLELAYTLMEGEKRRVAMDKSSVLATRRPSTLGERRGGRKNAPALRKTA